MVGCVADEWSVPVIPLPVLWLPVIPLPVWWEPVRPVPVVSVVRVGSVDGEKGSFFRPPSSRWPNVPSLSGSFGNGLFVSVNPEPEWVLVPGIPPLIAVVLAVSLSYAPAVRLDVSPRDELLWEVRGSWALVVSLPRPEVMLEV